MALSFKKSKTDAASAPTTESDDAGAYSLDPNETVAFDAMQNDDANGTAVSGTATNGVASTRDVARTPAKAGGLRSGPVVGLNIGSDSIKAIELQSRGGGAFVSALGSIQTPPDSVSDGVVMNAMALSRAIKQLFKQAGIKSRNVVSSVSGTSNLVVRVIEVPRMSDNELADNMKVDLDRYIPFAPSEVRHSFVALRELPSDPDSPNMEVLLAAAKNETIDQHVDVLDASRLRPVAIDVEPLAAARSVLYSGNDGAPLVSSEYSAATALINIGALSTEISVLRGDVVVFTRTIPGGGSGFTQALADSLGLALAEAEDAKRRLGDAIEPLQEAAPAVTAQAPDDWSNFGEPDTSAQSDTAQNAATQNAAPAQAATNDPFDSEFFDQGPRQNEPGEQHQQRQGGGETPSGDASSNAEPFGFDFDLLPSQEDGDETPGAEASASTRQTPVNAEAGALEFPMQGAQVSEAAPTGQMFHFDAADDPALPSFPTLPNVSASGDDEDEDLGTLPTTQREEDEDEAARPEPQLEPVAFGFGAGNTINDTATLPSAYDFPTSPVTPVAAPAAATAPAWTNFNADELATPIAHEEAEPSATDDIFDLDSLLQPTGAAVTGATIGGAPDPFAPPPVALEKIVATSDAPSAADFGANLLDDDFGTAFGTGLGAADTSALDAHGVYSVLSPLLAEMIGEVRRSLEYYMSRYPDAPVERIVLVGGGAKLRNIDAAFTQALSIPTLVANPLAHLSVKASGGAHIVEEDGPIYAVALGLALRDLV